VPECLGGRELQKLDLERLAVCSGASAALKNTASVVGYESQYPVLVGGEGVLGTGPGPQQDAEGQAHSRTPKQDDPQ
jgi:hypothetical protein